MGIIGVIGIVIGTIMIITTSTGGKSAFWYSGDSGTITAFVIGIIITLIGFALGITALVKASNK